MFVSGLFRERVLAVLKSSVCAPDVAGEFLHKVAEGGLTRDEDEERHFCVYFLPFNPETGEVFIVHHKKSGLWLAPGGHIDQGEVAETAVSREIDEELGFKISTNELDDPFLLTVTCINNRPQQSCRVHYDIWYLVLTDGSDFNIDSREFHETRWVSIEEARALIVDSSTLEALDVLGQRPAF